MKNLEAISKIQRQTEVPDSGLLCDLVWSDPDKNVLDFEENDRAVSVVFGEKIVT